MTSLSTISTDFTLSSAIISCAPKCWRATCTQDNAAHTAATNLLHPRYAWRVTGNTKYLDNAARAIDAFNKYLPATVGFSGIDDVNNVNSTKDDDVSVSL
jgi:hypothetical protein